MKIITLFMVVGTLFVTTFSWGQSGEQQIIEKMLADRNFKLIARTALPQGGPSISLNTGWDLKIKGDSVYCYLPYVGNAYSVPYGGGEGLNFNGVMNSYQIKETKRSTVVSFYVRTIEDNYRFNIDVSSSGGASIRVSPNTRQGISFTAYVDTSIENK